MEHERPCLDGWLVGWLVVLARVPSGGDVICLTWLGCLLVGFWAECVVCFRLYVFDVIFVSKVRLFQFLVLIAAYASIACHSDVFLR